MTDTTVSLEGRKLLDWFTAGIGKDHGIGDMNIDCHLVSDGPMDGFALLQVDRVARGEAQSVEDFAAKKLALFDLCENAVGVGVDGLMADHHFDRARRHLRRTGEIAKFGLNLRLGYDTIDKVGVADESGNKYS